MTGINLDRDHLYMLRALELAEWGRGMVSPNPLVGCVIVHQDKIIGEGFHEKYGGPHAEPNAIGNVSEPSLLSESTLYVTLEPCSHFGKTPPCAPLLVERRIKRVVIATLDPNPLVAGRGIEMLQANGIEVTVGVMEAKARHQNRRFFTFMQENRPYVLLKWAQTRDGFVAKENYDSKWISNTHSRQLVHKWRAEEDAILVGTRTAKHDNPSLTVRDWDGRNPVRVVIDTRLELDPDLSLFDGNQATICYNLFKNESLPNLEFVKLAQDFSIKDLLNDLHQRKIQSIMVEGGAFLLQKFIEAELWDEARVFIGQVNFDKGIVAPKLDLQRANESKVSGDRLLTLYRKTK
ncbi:bifunctional diaminohydroxyphosphoribosylaminopyrimidine deaminase/5-amino-6-(5-phosphoribosylamino)uracil reductase RibD [Pararhodonellum marinum]|uniref:bifunctional diaminohydroxyphosphoribosylaminopyrimidine deaminase/5-amino-6-(5-phosphoribosylamino)uracil reductase RibD n=1 Tax=Pararhodonellum marinum TaxID=2755358 RepID=UPI001E30F1F4|nr:bifunctional diaminohydroxyphosphoribosylaminopyrimidine deaminase/5-amino-6-(5-phosphoribosylamino)uracil reductase RibD [Pararhodonellum marinum]